MSTTLRRLPGFALGIVALALSASLSFAGQPAGAAPGLANASTHSGKSVPAKTAEEAGADEDTETDASTEPTEDDVADNCNVDLTQDVSVLETLNHGSVVCTAAHTETPDGYANHGAWVSHWAHLGKDAFNAAPKTHGNKH